MPELPEVETIRGVLQKKLVGKKIVSVYVDRHDHIVFDKDSPLKIQRALVNSKVIAIKRKGKYLWLELRKPKEANFSLVLHFGMTGNTEVDSSKGFIKAWGGEKEWAKKQQKKNKEKLPRFCRLLLETSEQTRIAYTDPRRFGRIRLARDPLAEPPLNRLGFDPLEHLPSPKDLFTLLHGRKAPIKAVLLDQSLFAGVGNWIADEVLFQAHISPHRKSSTLTPNEVKLLRNRLLYIIKTSVKLFADYDLYPDTWLFHDRWSKRKESYTSRGYEIKFDTVGGRTSAWVPALQK